MTLARKTDLNTGNILFKKLVIIIMIMTSGTLVKAQRDTISLHIQNEITDTNVSSGLSDDKADKKDNLHISGYTQIYFQYGEKDATLRVGRPNENPDNSFNRLGLRRNRVKFTYKKGIGSSIFQLDVTEKGATLKDAYITVSEPYWDIFSITAGLFNRPFGYETECSSSQRASLERSTIVQTLFPGERDLGAKLTVQAKKSSRWSVLKLDMGLFAGNSSNMETDNKKDFIGHLTINPSSENVIKWNAGISYYNGGIYQGSNHIFRSVENGFAIDSAIYNIGKYAKREYLGADIQININTAPGKTELTAEYITGQQPGGKNISKSPDDSRPKTEDVYIRSMSGGYVKLVQELGFWNLSGIVKYDWYDPNTQVKGKDTGSNYTGIGDIATNVTGFGLLWQINSNIQFTAYYELIRNETSVNLSGYNTDRKDNVFTFRMQYKY